MLGGKRPWITCINMDCPKKEEQRQQQEAAKAAAEGEEEGGDRASETPESTLEGRTTAKAS